MQTESPLTRQPAAEDLTALVAAVKHVLENPAKLYSPNRAAQMLDISRSKIYDLMKRGLLHYVMIDSDRRIPASEVERVTKEGIPADKPSLV